MTGSPNCRERSTTAEPLNLITWSAYDSTEYALPAYVEPVPISNPPTKVVKLQSIITVEALPEPTARYPLQGIQSCQDHSAKSIENSTDHYNGKV